MTGSHVLKNEIPEMISSDTARKYSYLWKRYKGVEPPERCHFDCMQEVISQKIVNGAMGLDLGCGLGWDTFKMAKGNPRTRVVGMDICDVVSIASEVNKKLPNVSVFKGSATDIPLKNGVCDFVYSFGVLHHMQNYIKGLKEINRVLKKKSPVFLYLYEDHSGNLLKYIAVKIVGAIRKVTVGIPLGIAHILTYIFSPILFLLFSCPAKVFKRFKCTYGIYEKMPFNFAGSPFSLCGDLYDRFTTPVEIRFGRKALHNLLVECNFTDVEITKLEATAGWVVTARKGIPDIDTRERC